LSPALYNSRKPHWRTGLFKENSRCVRCGRKLNLVSKICDSCVVEIYIISMLTGEPVKSIAKRYDITDRMLRRRLHIIREKGDLLELLCMVVDNIRRISP